jgi:hypothetical protein
LEIAMIQPTHRDEDDPIPRPADDPPGVVVWAITGCALVLAYVALLALLRPPV